MRKITIIEHISLDGIIQAPGGPDEDRDGGFAHGGWAAPHDDPEQLGGEAIDGAHGEHFDLLLGRRTYDIWAGYWPQADGPMADKLNGATKFVATHRPEILAWGPAEALAADSVYSIGRIKAAGGPNLITWGSSSLTPVLLEHGLADEVLLMIFPVLLGTGKRFFSEGAPPRELKLIRTRKTSTGVMLNTYRPAGPLRTGISGKTTG